MLYKAKHYLNKRYLLVLHYSFIHISWGSTNKTNLKKINCLQKHAIWIIHCKDRFAHARELFRESKILNVFQLNILNNFVFMHKIKSQTAIKILQNKFSKPTNKYPTNFSTSNYSILLFKLSKSKYRISIRGPTLWKNVPANSQKMQESVNVFKILWEKSFWNFKMKQYIFKSNCLKSWNTGRSFPKVFFEKVALKILVFSG